MDDSPSYEVVVILGAENDASGRLSEMTVERARGGLREYWKRPGSKLLLTGGYGLFNQAAEPHAVYLARYLVEQGLDARDLLPFAISAHTVEDAALAQKILADYAVQAITIVTSEVHLARARLIFEHFFKAEPQAEPLTFVGTPNAVSPARLETMRLHETKSINLIKKQGGIIYEGRLIRSPLC